MNEIDVMNIIRQQCCEQGRLLEALRRDTFLEADFNSLMKALRSYRAYVRGRDTLHRETAYYLYELDAAFSATYRRVGQDTVLGARISEAQLECSELIVEVFTPEVESDE